MNELQRNLNKLISGLRFLICASTHRGTMLPRTGRVSLLRYSTASPLESDKESSQSEQIPVDDSELSNRLQIRLKIRNPRNPEHFGWNKPRGCDSQYRRRDFYCRLNMFLTNRHIKANVEHHSGRILASASTAEFDIAKHLYKTTNINAAYNIGRVLRQRCLEAGITRMLWDPKRGRGKERFQAIKKGFTGNGIALCEPRRVIFPEQVVAAGVYNKRKKYPLKRKTNTEKAKWYV